MIIVVGNWKQKVVKLVAAIVIVSAFAVIIPRVSGVFSQKVPVFSGWFQDEHPSGNPIRVQAEPEGTQFEQQMDRFVLKVQNFYYEEKE